MRFQDRGVLVTGGGSGIGQQVCYAAAEEGARVAVGDLDLERAQATAAEIRRRKGEAHAFLVNVADPPSATAFVAAAETSLGRLDVLVNSAGIREIVSVLDLSFVNAVAPGVVRTPLTERYFQDPAYAQAIRDIHALGRWAEPEEIARAILFLADEANGFITGSILTVDGGWTIGKKM